MFILRALGKCATRKALLAVAGCFLDKSAFLLNHGARTTPSFSLMDQKSTPALVFGSLSGIRTLK